MFGLASANPLISSQGGSVQGNEPLIEPTQEMEQRIDISPHFSVAPAAAGASPDASAGGPVRPGDKAPWSPSPLHPGCSLRWKEI